ncbi:MAG: carbamoyltransferase [Candidatus Omnitrophica bacterium]|nr:carbamoyltransferase [Candidatus Omnitrophota bacterium]
MRILGISCFYHDAAAALIVDGEVVAAAQEERFTRKKHDSEFPSNAIAYCLKRAAITVDDLEHIVFYDKPFVKFERILKTYVATWPKSFSSFLKAMPLWIKRKIWTEHIIQKELNYRGEILFLEHHLSHAASAFLVSPFKEAAILTVDGVGEWATATCGKGEGNDIKILKEMHFPHSLGLLYTAFTYYLGFRVNSAEYKVMGLAPYGKPIYYDLIMEKLVRVKGDGSFKVKMDYFSYDYGLRMINKRFEKLFGRKTRKPEEPLEVFHKDVAASIQKVTEEIVLKMAHFIHELTGMDNLCMAGGVALNCVANGRVLREGPFKNIFIQPAAGDAGGAVGAAAYVYHTLLGKKRESVMQDVYLGPDFSTDEICGYLEGEDIDFTEHDEDGLLDKVAGLLNQGAVVGWFQGRMEFGPRALGARSILADPRKPDMKYILNSKIKFREEFRPFAPTVLETECHNIFELERPSPFMLLTAQVRKEAPPMPAITHVNGSARIQTVTKEQNRLYHGLIERFRSYTGVGVIVNTSFNLRGEPVVCTPEEAYRCFMRSGIDYLAIGQFVLDKKKMKPWVESADWKKMLKSD